MKYIDAEKLKAELDKRYAEYRAKMKTDDFTYYEGMADALDLFEQYIDSFPEQREVDFEIGKYMTTNLLKKRNHSTGIFHLTQKDYATIANHFYEMGLNAKKEDKK